MPTLTWERETVAGCPCCGSPHSWVADAEERRGVPLQFVRCVGCSLVYQSPRLTREARLAYFNSTTFRRDGHLTEALGYYDYAAWEWSARETATMRLRAILRHRPAGGRLLEIGPATGVFMQEAERQGFMVRGLELSATLAAQARGRTGLPVDEGAIEETLLTHEAYDVIVCFGGFSCWADPLWGLRHVRQGLRPRGIFVCNVPDADHWLPRLLGRRYPEYNPASLTIVSRQSFARLLAQAGLRIVRSETERQSATLGRIATYFQRPWAVRWLTRLGLMNVTIPVRAFGTRLVIAEAA